MDGYPSLSTNIALVSTEFNILAALHVPFRQFANSCTFHSGKWSPRNILYLVRTLFHCFQYTARILWRSHSVHPWFPSGFSYPLTGSSLSTHLYIFWVSLLLPGYSTCFLLLSILWVGSSSSWPTWDAPAYGIFPCIGKSRIPDTSLYWCGSLSSFRDWFSGTV